MFPMPTPNQTIRQQSTISNSSAYRKNYCRMDDNAVPDEFEGVAREFLYLIKPIQELKDNWDVDICGNLKQFIEKVVAEEGM